jgi:K+-sensing histidine kinase KdpD
MDILENIKYQSKMLTNLINDLLDLAKMDSLNFKFNEDYFDVKELISRAIQTIQYTAK